MQRRELGFGEAFINTGNPLRPFDALTALQGCKIKFFGGGNSKVFVVCEDQFGGQKIVPLHPAEVDQYDYTVSDGQDTENFTMNTTGQMAEKVDMGRVEQLISDQSFNLFLNDKGEVFVTGQGIYGVLGLGNRRLAMAPTKVFSSKQGVKSIACGSGHCMLLTNDRSLYAWGRNFEGQLGIPYLQISCKPTHNPFFNYTQPKLETDAQKKLCIEDVYLAGCHSFAVLSDRSLYAWGENLYGQLGLPRKSKYVNPMKVPLSFGVGTIAAAKTHTLLLSADGLMHSAGLNNYGQLGLGHMAKQDTFAHIFEDFHNNPLPAFRSVQTNYNSGLAVTTGGELYVWGRAVLLDEKQVQPVKVEMQKDIATLDHVYLSNLNCLVFSKLMAYDVTPKVSPSSGNTKCSIRGYGFADFNGRQKVRFRLSLRQTKQNATFDDDRLAQLNEIADKYHETPMVFNATTNTFEFTTPVFYTEHYVGDAEARIDISLDGESWIETPLSMVIYNCNTRILEITPRYVHVDDRQQLKIQLTNPLKLESPFDEDIRVEFLQKAKIKKRTSRFGNEPETLPDANKLPKLYSVVGTLVDGGICCELQETVEFKDSAHSNLPYTCFVSVSLDGQQLFESCLELTYYSISGMVVSPLCVKFEGGICHSVEFDNAFDSPFAAIQLAYEDQVSTVKPTYSKPDRLYEFHSPMLTPPTALRQEEAGNETELPKLNENIEVDLRITLCGNYYQSAGKLFYHNPRITALLAQLEKEKNEPEEDYRSRVLRVEDPFKISPELNDKEADKRRREIDKRLNVLENVLKNGVAKARDFILVRGENFVVGSKVQIKLTWSEDLLVVAGIAKSENLIAFEVPDLISDQTGVTEVSIDVSFNGKQYTSAPLKFEALLLSKDTPSENREKETTEFLKKYKKPKHK